MSASRDYVVTIYYRDKVHEMLATATSCGAALDVALKDQRTLRQAVKARKASYEVETWRATS